MENKGIVDIGAIKAKAFAVSAWRNISQNFERLRALFRPIAASQARENEDFGKATYVTKPGLKPKLNTVSKIDDPCVSCYEKGAGIIRASAVYGVVTVRTKRRNGVAIVELRPWAAFSKEVEVLRSTVIADKPFEAENEIKRDFINIGKKLINDISETFHTYEVAYAKYLSEAKGLVKYKPEVAEIYQFIYDGGSADELSGGGDVDECRQLLNDIGFLILNRDVSADTPDRIFRELSELTGTISGYTRNFPEQFRVTADSVSGAIADLLYAIDAKTGYDGLTVLPLIRLANIVLAAISFGEHDFLYDPDDDIIMRWRNLVKYIGGGSLLNAWVNAAYIDFRNAPDTLSVLEMHDGIALDNAYEDIIPERFIDKEANTVDIAGLYEAYRDAYEDGSGRIYNYALAGLFPYVHEDEFRPIA